MFCLKQRKGTLFCDLLDLISSSGFGCRICNKMSASVIAFLKITQIAEWGTKVLSGDTYSFRGCNTSLSSKLKKGIFFQEDVPLRPLLSRAIQCRE